MYISKKKQNKVKMSNKLGEAPLNFSIIYFNYVL